MASGFFDGRPKGSLLILAAFLLVAHVVTADKEKHTEVHHKVPKPHHRAPVHHLHETAREVRVEPAKRTHHYAAKVTAASPAAEGHHRAALKTKATAPQHHHVAEHHPDKHAKHRAEEPKRRLEVQKPPKPFLQPPLLPKHERPSKHHHVRVEKDKHH